MKLFESIPLQICKIVSMIENGIGICVDECKHIKSGCYAEIYMIKLSNKKRCIIKHYNHENVITHEIQSYRILKKYQVFPMPQIYMYDVMHNYILMEFVEGITLSSIDSNNTKIASEVIEYLLKCHNTEIEGSVNIWIKKYCEWQTKILDRSELLVNEGLLDRKVYDQFKCSKQCFHELIYKSVNSLSLIHGDYTPWNIIIDSEQHHVAAIIDPYMSCFGDREYDLMMLDKANGCELKLLDAYRDCVQLSANFDRKKIYYNSWNELCHYYYSNKKTEMNILERTYELMQVI